MHEYMEKLCVVLLLVVAFGKTEETVEDGGYSVLVTFSQNVPEKDGAVLLNNMKESLKDASVVLHNAIGFHFSKVMFMIPMGWDTSGLNVIEHSSNFDSFKADFLVDNSNDTVFGKLPFAQQYGSCGIPGKQIIIPTAFFDEGNTFPKGINLAREWLKYRYGVFDENGYFGDPLYPMYYKPPRSDSSEINITDCTNTEVIYNFLDKSGNNCSTTDKTLLERLDSRECIIKVDENLNNVTSSIMYFQQDLHTVQHICGKDADHGHNSRSPNKHNALCHGQSIWDVVKKSLDFKTERATEGFGDIDFVYVREAKPKVVVAWENTEHIKNKGPIILNVIKKFLIDLPSGSKFSGFPFHVRIPEERNYDLHDLNEPRDKQGVANDIFSGFEQEDADVSLAISKSLDILSSEHKDSEIKGTIIIITKSGGTLQETLLQSLTDSKVCIMFMVFTEGDIPEAITSYASASNCSLLEEFPMANNDEDTFEKLLTAMETILPSIGDDKAMEMVKTGYLTKESPMSVPVNIFDETVTFWIFSKKEGDNFKLEFNGEKQENVFKGERIRDVLLLSYSPPQSGNIEVSYLRDTEKMLTHVTKISKEGKYFSGKIFVHDTSEEESPVQMPVIVYAFIRFGSYPVQNAKVSATIKRPNQEDINLDLNDDGRGDPDITQNDGIYSRYFTSFSEKGKYTVTVTVKNNGDLTTFGADENTGYQTCCGSYVNGGTSKLTEFSKEFTTFFMARNSRPEEGYKPSRIADLRIVEVTDDKITLKWTAPGQEADYGTALSYEIKCFVSQDEALNNFDDGNPVFNFTGYPKESGNIEIFDINFDDFDNGGLCYMAIKTKNANKASDISNLIEIFIPEQKTTVAPGDGNEETGKDAKKSGVNNKTIGIIIGIIVGVILLVLIVYLAVYYLVMKPKRRKEAKQLPTTQPPMASENNVLNPINFISAATLIEHHNEKTKAKIQNKEPPIFREEDFEDRNSLPINESTESTSNNDQLSQNKNRAIRNDEPMPPKSPKRTTYV